MCMHLKKFYTCFILRDLRLEVLSHLSGESRGPGDEVRAKILVSYLFY